MDRFVWLSVDKTTGRPALAGSETLLAEEPSIRIYDGDDKTDFDCGTLWLTALRLIWFEGGGAPRAIQLPLSLVLGVDVYKGFAFASSPKLILSLARPPVPQAPGPTAFSANNVVKLSFRDSSATKMEYYRTALGNAIAQQEWLKTPLSSVSPRPAGLEAIHQRKMAEMQLAERTIEVAFAGDLKTLQERAKEMVALAERYSTAMSKGSGEVSDDDRSQLQTCLLNLGIDTPVTRKTCSSGTAFHRGLCKELDAFLVAPMAEAKGILALTDVYCMYARARGSELISPDDLLHACEFFVELNSTFRLRIFANGVRVVEYAGRSTETIAEEVATLLAQHEYLSASSYAKIKGIPPMLAEEHLQYAETLGRVCRDDSMQGLRFYANRLVHG